MTTMALKSKEKEWQKKLEEADCAMENVLDCLVRIGENGEKHLALFIEEVRPDGKTHSRRL